MRLLELCCKKSAVFCYSTATQKIRTHKQTRKGCLHCPGLIPGGAHFTPFPSLLPLPQWQKHLREGGLSSISSSDPSCCNLDPSISRSLRSAISGGILSSGCTLGSLEAVKRNYWASVAQSIRQPTLDFSSSHDLKVVGWSPVLGSALSIEPA